MNKFWTKRIEKIEEEVVAWIKNYVENASANGVVIGISGGVDSSVAAALCVKALGKDKVYGISLPQGNQHDIDCAKQLIKHLDITSEEINIAKTVNTISNRLSHRFGFDVNENKVYKSNTPARIRMTYLYGIAALFGGLVVNTCNRSENYIGYSTKFGDHAGDFSPLWNLTKMEIKMLGHHLGLPKNLVEKVPEDGLSGKTDEDNLGFTYDELDMYLLYGVMPETDEAYEKIMNAHYKNLHKMNPMPAYEPEEIK